MAMWNPWRGSKKCSESCLHCYIHKGDARRGIDTNQIVIIAMHEAYSFLESFLGNVAPITEKEFEKVHEIGQGDFTEDNVVFIPGYSGETQYQNWSEFSIMIGEYADAFAEFDNYRIPLPTADYPKCKIKGTDKVSDILLLWKNEKVMIFEDETEKVVIQGWTSLYVNDINPAKYVNMFSGVDNHGNYDTKDNGKNVRR